jgi:hypothetical protein
MAIECPNGLAGLPIVLIGFPNEVIRPPFGEEWDAFFVFLPMAVKDMEKVYHKTYDIATGEFSFLWKRKSVLGYGAAKSTPLTAVSCGSCGIS